MVANTANPWLAVPPSLESPQILGCTLKELAWLDQESWLGRELGGMKNGESRIAKAVGAVGQPATEHVHLDGGHKARLGVLEFFLDTRESK
ncbi:MAG: hypothetical protein AABZ47_19005 [Planctomycetota bacterium]